MEGDAVGKPSHWGVGVNSTIQERVRAANATRTPLRIAGRSHWLRAGRPVAATETLSLAGHSGVVDYVPGDLTITIRAGTTLAELERIVGEQGQWFPVNPYGSSEGTIGATVATASSGPLSHGFGTIRDLVLGVTFVTGEGRLVSGGGRVVKNVAGFDLVRLLTGSWGTLGVITELSLRLYALPAERLTMRLDAPTDLRRLANRLGELLSAPILPFALELLSEGVAARVGLARRPTILALLGGNAAAVRAQRDALAKLGAADEVSEDAWDKLRSVEGPESSVFRISGLPTQLAERWERARTMMDGVDESLMDASIARGTVRCILPDEPTPRAIEAMSSPHPSDTVIFESLPSGLWTRFSPTAIADRVSQGIRSAFDPLGILNPGILGPSL